MKKNANNILHYRKILYVFLGTSAFVFLAFVYSTMTDSSRVEGERFTLDTTVPDTIYLITLDTTRADHLGMYGYSRPTSPFLDSLAENGVVFDKAVSVSSHTGTVHASVFTGLFPFQHGYLNHKQTRSPLNHLKNLPTFLTEKGYVSLASTAAFGQFNIVFDGFFADWKHGKNSAVSLREKNHPLHADTVVDSALELLQKHSQEEKVFLWLHFFDAHIPYRDFPPLRRADGSKVSQADLPAIMHKQQLFPESETYTAKQVRSIDSYDRGIRFIDTQLQRFFERVKKIRQDSSDVVIVFADHGEGLGGHGYYEHSDAIFNEQVRSALMIGSTRPNAVQPGRHRTPVSLVDIFKTVCDLLQSSRECANVPLEGESLKPFLFSSSQDDIGATDRVVLSQRRHYVLSRSKPPKTGPEPWPPYELFALQDTQFKFMKRFDGELALYDLATDFYERKNLAAQLPKEVARWEKRLNRFLAERGYKEPILAVVE